MVVPFSKIVRLSPKLRLRCGARPPFSRHCNDDLWRCAGIGAVEWSSGHHNRVRDDLRLTSSATTERAKLNTSILTAATSVRLLC